MLVRPVIVKGSVEMSSGESGFEISIIWNERVVVLRV
jgi:hypothetical protein